MTEALIIIPSIIAVWLGIMQFSAWRHRRREAKTIHITLEGEWKSAEHIYWDTMMKRLENVDDNSLVEALKKTLKHIEPIDQHKTLDPTQLKQLTDNLPKN